MGLKAGVAALRADTWNNLQGHQRNKEVAE